MATRINATSRFSVPVTGAGLGLHRSQMPLYSSHSNQDINFMEVAPENWINVGGRHGRELHNYTEKFPFVCHGLSLSIGSPAPLNTDLLGAIKIFLREHNILYYSEHLSYSGSSSNLYELLPIPFTEDAVHYVAARIRQAQDILGQRIAIENPTYYFNPTQEMSEYEFINAVLCEADCALLLDVNNLYINSHNHQYDAMDFLQKIHGERTAYIHIAGHDQEKEDFLVDTHGSPIIGSVWSLLEESYRLYGVKPTLLERENNIPPPAEIMQEINFIKRLQHKALGETLK